MKVAVVTLGCDKNSADAELLAGVLAARGHAVVAEGAQSAVDVLVLLTCGFIEAAREQTLDTLEAFLAEKETHGNPRGVVVAGCMVQRHAADLAEDYPQADAFFGVGPTEELADLVERIGRRDPASALARPASPLAGLAPSAPRTGRDHALPRMRLDALPHAFLKIADGCDHGCAFCAIPGMKGRYVSVPREILLDEARRLLDAGVREIDLVAQDVAPYGRDLYGAQYGLPDLLEDLCRLPGDFWIRLLYFYPAGITPRFLEVFAREPRICKYLDIPLQHLDPGVLRAMHRPEAAIEVAEKIAALRAGVPDLALRTTLITGFPGESPQAFQRLLEGIETLRFDWVGAFAFSPEAGTPAADFERQVSERTAEKRRGRLMAAQQRISLSLQRERIGRTLRVLVESVSGDGRRAFGRSQREAPEVDGSVTIDLSAGVGRPAPRPGDFLAVRITEAGPYDLYGHPCTD